MHRALSGATMAAPPVMLAAAVAAGTFADQPPAPAIAIRPCQPTDASEPNGTSAGELTGHKLYTCSVGEARKPVG